MSLANANTPITNNAGHPTASPPSSTINPRLLIMVAAFCCFVVALQQTLVISAIPNFPALLHLTANTVAWIVTATLLTGALSTPIFGRLSDLVGKKRIMLLSVALVLVGSLIALIGTGWALIVGRALQGMGTALVPVAMAQMRDSLNAEQTRGALAILSSILGIGGAIGIPLGGLMLSTLGWQSMFWLSAVLSLICIGLILRFIPANRADDNGTFDGVGAVLLSVALVSMLLAISQGNAWGWLSMTTLGCLIVGLVASVVWVKYELTQPSPIIDIRTSTAQPLLFTNLASLSFGVLMFMNLLLTTLRLQNPMTEGGFGWSPALAGTAMLPTAVVMLIVAPLSTRLAKQLGARKVLMLGAVISIIGYGLCRFFSLNAALVIGWTTLISAGVGIGYAALPMLVVQYAPLHELGSANGVNALLRAIGTAIASAVVGALTIAMAVKFQQKSIPTAEALALLAMLGIGVAVITLVLAYFAKPRQVTA